jgi:hypothetical protein
MYAPEQTGRVGPKTMRQRWRNMFTRKPKRDPLNNYTAMGGPPPASPRPRQTFRNMVSGMFRRTPRNRNRHRSVNSSRHGHGAGAASESIKFNRDLYNWDPAQGINRSHSISRSRNHSRNTSKGPTQNMGRSPSRNNASPVKITRMLLRKTAQEREKNIKEVLSIPKDSDQSKDDFYADRLIQILTSQSHGSESEIDNIIAELKSISNFEHGSKEGHWLWWVFPTEKAGIADELKTKLTQKTANRFLNNLNDNPSLESKWKKCIQLIIGLLNIQSLKHIEKIPQEDLGRIEHFCKFWNGWGKGIIKPTAKHVPEWLKELCDRLEIALIILNA